MNIFHFKKFTKWRHCIHVHSVSIVG
uniref:Uncharacterized protein n=1 Tax=Anguilla anguilla TaxID=7936 RepID=A0A0E9UC32_ANGAN